MTGISDEEVFEAFPAVALDHDNVEHYRGRLRRALVVNRCGDCGRWHEPPRALCPACWSPRIEGTEVSGQGAIALMTVLHHGPAAPGVDYEAGLPVVGVELVEQAGLRVTASLIGIAPLDVRLGMAVECVWIERGGVPTPAFRPVA